jgi:hypothetical protein
VGAVQVDYRPRLGMGSVVAVSVQAVQAMIDVKSVACRQAIEPTNRHSCVSLSLDRWAGITPVIAPHHGLAEVSMEHLARFRHDHFQSFSATWPRHGGDGQPLDEFSEAAAFIRCEELGLFRPAALRARGDYPGSGKHSGFDEFSSVDHLSV